MYLNTFCRQLVQVSIDHWELVRLSNHDLRTSDLPLVQTRQCQHSGRGSSYKWLSCTLYRCGLESMQTRIVLVLLSFWIRIRACGLSIRHIKPQVVCEQAVVQRVSESFDKNWFEFALTIFLLFYPVVLRHIQRIVCGILHFPSRLLPWLVKVMLVTCKYKHEL